MTDIRQELDEVFAEKENAKVAEELTARPHPWTEWVVGGETYKLKLQAGVIATLERTTFKHGLLDAVISDGIPPVSTSLAIIQGAMQKYHHGFNSDKVETLYDRYVDEGHSQTDLFRDVLLPLLRDAGFFTTPQMESLRKSLSIMTNSL